MSSITLTHDGFPVGGYRHDLENSRLLRETSTDVSRLLLSDIKAPEEFDPRGLFRSIEDPRDDLQVEDQGQQGSCAGHAASSVVEFVNWIDTKRMVQLSRAFAYYAAQMEDGITGDQGSTINGCASVVRKYGIPLETSWPYPDRYDPRPPGGWEEQYRNAENFRIGSHTFLESARDVVQYLRAGAGGVQIGISWGGEVDSHGVFRWRPGGGGHSVMLCGWKQIGSDMFVWLLNSWGNRWGDDGWALLNYRTIEQMFQHQHTVMVGYSDMENPDHTRDIYDFIKHPIYR